MLMQAIEACENRWLKIAFHLSFTATLRLGELLGLTWDCVEMSQKAIDSNSTYIIINKEVERISKKAVEALKQKETIEALGDMYENYNLVLATSYGLPLGESYLRDKMQEVIDREGLPDVIFGCYKELIRLRKKYPVFTDGDFQLLLKENEEIFAYIREDRHFRLFVICNFHDQTVSCPLKELGISGQLLVSSYKDMGSTEVLRPYEAGMYLQEK